MDIRKDLERPAVVVNEDNVGEIILYLTRLGLGVESIVAGVTLNSMSPKGIIISSPGNGRIISPFFNSDDDLLDFFEMYGPPPSLESTD